MLAKFFYYYSYFGLNAWSEIDVHILIYDKFIKIQLLYSSLFHMKFGKRDNLFIKLCRSEL